MEGKFEGFESSFKMTYSATQSEKLLRLQVMKDIRAQIDVQIAIGIAAKVEILIQLKSYLGTLDELCKIRDSKVKENQCFAVVDSFIKNLTQRIKNMWNNLFLLFPMNDGPGYDIVVNKHTNRTSSCFNNCGCYNVSYKHIATQIEMLSTQEGTFDFASSDFIKILQTTAFVDKTLMIKELFQNQEFKRTVVTAPRKYGKSTNLTMLKYFLEIQVDSLGKPLTKANAEQPITDTSNYKLFKGLKISKESNIMNKYFGKYPVMYANFKIEMHIKTYDCVVEVCKEVIHKAFQSHNYLQKSSKLNNKEKNLCKLWCDDAYYKTIRTIDYIIIGFKSLCKCLKKHYNKACFVLIDEPDSLLMIFSMTNSLFDEYKDISLFLSRCLLFLKNEEFVVRAFVTGKSDYAISGIVPSCIKIQRFCEFHAFTDYYGFTINELEYLFEKPEFNGMTMTLKEVKAYYGSYNKIDQLSKTKKEIYCIWSILNVLKYKRLDNFWRDFGTIFCKFLNPTIKDSMQQLLNNESNMALVYDTTKPKTYPDTPQIIPASGTLTEKSLDYFFNLLLDLGYLTYASDLVQVLDMHNNTSTCIYVKIPNKEVREDIKIKIKLVF